MVSWLNGFMVVQPCNRIAMKQSSLFLFDVSFKRIDNQSIRTVGRCFFDMFDFESF